MTAENDIQESLACYLDYLGLTWFHTPNEGKMKPQYGAKRKRMGVKAGVPDVLIFDRPPAKPDYIGVALELKTTSGRLTKPQKEWLNRLGALGWFADCCYGLDQAMDTLAELGW